MIKLIRLYSDDQYFQEIKFNSGVNLICGDKSRDNSGKITSHKQNGVGKSLAIELINFCMLKKESESRVMEIPAEFLPLHSFVNLQIEINDKNFIISRNKAGDIRIKEVGMPYDDFSLKDAQHYLKTLFGLTEISLRTYLNFVIKEEDYVYKNLIEFFKSTYADLLEPHFYFFDLKVSILENIKKLLKEKEVATTSLNDIKKSLERKNIIIEELKAQKNELEQELSKIESNMEYEDIVKKLESNGQNINEIESKINELIVKEKAMKLELYEITRFGNIFDEDFYIDDKDITLVFNKYKQGLGDYISADIKEVQNFKKQLLEFKNELLEQTAKKIQNELYNINLSIKELTLQIEENYKDIIVTKSNNIVKNFRILKDQLTKLEQYRRYISNYEENESKLKVCITSFNDQYKLLDENIQNISGVVESFRTTFNNTHEAIMHTTKSSFNIAAHPEFAAKSYFTLDVYIQGQGSKGTNQIKNVIYDLSLINNSFTKTKHKGFIIHDNLIFGSVDKDSSISTLNYLHSMDPQSFQYIATVNKDDFDYKELSEMFNFDVKSYVKLELTKELPLFPSWKE